MNGQRLEQFRDALSSTSFQWIGLVVALVVMAVLVYRIRAWYRDGDDPADTADEIARQMQEMHRRGDLSEEEYRSIKSRNSRRQAE